MQPSSLRNDRKITSVLRCSWPMNAPPAQGRRSRPRGLSPWSGHWKATGRRSQNGEVISLPILSCLAAESRPQKGVFLLVHFVSRKGERLSLRPRICPQKWPDQRGSTKNLSQNRPQRGGQAHFAPSTPQNEPVPDVSAASKLCNSATTALRCAPTLLRPG